MERSQLCFESWGFQRALTEALWIILRMCKGFSACFHQPRVFYLPKNVSWGKKKKKSCWILGWILQKHSGGLWQTVQCWEEAIVLSRGNALCWTHLEHSEKGNRLWVTGVSLQHHGVDFRMAHLGVLYYCLWHLACLLAHQNTDLMPAEGKFGGGRIFLRGWSVSALPWRGASARVFRWAPFSVGWIQLLASPSRCCTAAGTGCFSKRGGFATQREQWRVRVWEVTGGWACVQEQMYMGGVERQGGREQVHIEVSEHLKIRAFD